MGKWLCRHWRVVRPDQVQQRRREQNPRQDFCSLPSQGGERSKGSIAQICGQTVSVLTIRSALVLFKQSMAVCRKPGWGQAGRMVSGMARRGFIVLVLLLVILVAKALASDLRTKAPHAPIWTPHAPGAAGNAPERGLYRSAPQFQTGHLRATIGRHAADGVLAGAIYAPVWPTDTITTTAYLPLMAKRFQPGTDGVWITIMEDSFEGSFPGVWTVEDREPGAGEYTWGQRDCRSFEGANSAWAVGGGADGDRLACGDNYPDHAYAWMRYGPFSLSGAMRAEVIFQRWHRLESQHDSLQWLASTNGSDVHGWKVWGDYGGWKETIFDLTTVPTLGNLAGQPSVWILLVFESNGSTSHPEGAYVDNLTLRKLIPISTAAAP